MRLPPPAWVAILGTLALWLVAATQALATPVPDTARAYKRDLIREARARWGLDAPVALLAAQVHTESAWRPDAESPYADGLAQFTPATAEWMAELYPDALGEPAPFSARWSLRALVYYDHRLHEAIRPRTGPAFEPCDHWAMTLSAYNGGIGWLGRDRRLAAEHGADPDRWWGHVERYTPRADWAREENRAYPRRILYRWTPIYQAAGWPGPSPCY